MCRPSMESRASPVAMPKDLRKLIRETFVEIDKRLAIMTMIERHLDHLNGLGEYDRAYEFLIAEEQEIRKEAKRLGAERRRATIRLVVQTTSPTLVVIIVCVARYLAAKHGVIF